MTAEEAYQDYKASRGFMEASLSWSRAATEEDFRLLAVHTYEAGRAEGRREGYAEALRDAEAELRLRMQQHQLAGMAPHALPSQCDQALHAETEAEFCLEAVRALESEEK